MYNLCNTCERTAAIESVIYPSNTTGVKGCVPLKKASMLAITRSAMPSRDSLELLPMCGESKTLSREWNNGSLAT